MIYFIILLRKLPFLQAKESYRPLNVFPSSLFCRIHLSNSCQSYYCTLFGNHLQCKDYKLLQMLDHSYYYNKSHDRLRLLGRFPFWCKRREKMFYCHLSNKHLHLESIYRVCTLRRYIHFLIYKLWLLAPNYYISPRSFYNSIHVLKP